MFKKGANLYLGKNYDKNLDMIKQELAEGENFDLIVREVRVGGRRAALICLDGFVKEIVLTECMKSLAALKKEVLVSSTIKGILEKGIPYVELDMENKIDELLFSVLSGSVLLIVEGSEQAFIIDPRSYPARDPEEPDIERVVRGSRDGFTETLVFNTALLRRRIRDPKLRIELLQAGKRSKTDICVCYLKDVADPELVEDIKSRISAIAIDALPMAEKSVEELIMPGVWWNPFPKVRYTERPDVAAVHLFEGHVLIMVDTSPSTMILPVTYFHHLQHAEEYRQSPSVGIYIRWVRFIAVAASVIITPLWLLLALSPEILPASLKFIGPKEMGNVPIFLQFVIAEISLDMMRMAAIHTPSPLATALGVIAALLIGDIAVKIGLLIPEVILYTAMVAIGSFCTPSYEMAMANRLMRFFILLGTGFFRLPGFIVSSILVILLAGFTKSLKVPYLWPLVPFNFRALKNVLFRSPVTTHNRRPEILHTLDRSRQPGPAFKKRREE